MTASRERPTQTDRDYERVRELGARLRNLERDLERTYRPALRRLAAQDEPGGHEALAELDEGCGVGFGEALDCFRRAVDGVLYAHSDRDRWTYYEFALDQGRLRAGERSDGAVMADLVDNFGDATQAGDRYLAGKEKAAL
jgi:hypothetical protein